MTEITHHLTPELLTAYAAGSLPEAFGLVVATHVSLCDDCRAALAAHEAVGGVLLDALPAASLAPGSLDDTFARIASPATTPEAPRTASDDVIPAPLAGYIGGGLSDIRWRPVGGGVRQMILSTSDEATARLLYIPGGVEVPEHSHGGLELTLVLQGAFADEGGQFLRGDVEIGDEELQHIPVAAPGEACICLAATDAPLRFSGWLPRLAQPFLRI